MSLRKRSRERFVEAVEQTVEDLETPLPDPLPHAPEGGWQPEDFPQVTVASIPYTSDPKMRADPNITVLAEGWLYLEVGTTRLAIPDREEWGRLVHMVEATYNTHERLRVLRAASEAQEALEALEHMEEVDERASTP